MQPYNNNNLQKTNTNTNIAKESDFQDFGFMGNEGIELADIKVPQLIIIQALSEHLLTAHKDRGIKPGDLFNDVTSTIYAEPIKAVPLIFKKNYHVENLAVGATKAKVIQKLLELPESAKKVPATSYWIDESDPHQNKIYECFNYFWLLEDGSTIQTQLKKSKLKIGRKLNSLFAQKVGVPLFRHKYIISTSQEKAEKGTYFNYEFTAAEPCTVDEYNNAGNKAQSLMGLIFDLLSSVQNEEHE